MRDVWHITRHCDLDRWLPDAECTMIAEVVMHFGNEWRDLLLIIFGCGVGGLMGSIIQIEINNRKKQK